MTPPEFNLRGSCLGQRLPCASERAPARSFSTLLEALVIPGLTVWFLSLFIDAYNLRLVDQLLQHPGDGVARLVLELGPRRLRVLIGV